MVYAVGKQVFVKDISGRAITGFLKEFKGYVSGLAMYDNHLYASVRRTDNTHSSIHRLNLTSWEDFHLFNATDSDILSMVIAKGYIYLGLRGGFLMRCSVNDSSNCERYRLAKGEYYNIRVAELEYNPRDSRVYAVISYKRIGELDGEWSHFIRRCSTAGFSCDKMSVELKGRAILCFGFDALWIADYGVLRRCPVLKIDNRNCFVFHDFENHKYVNVVSSREYLYARVESSNQIWRCDPKVRNSCTKAFEVRDHESNIGSFIFV